MNSHVPLKYPGETAVVMATGPSLTADVRARVASLRRHNRVRVFTMNNVFQHYDGIIDVHTACDPQWWQTYGRQWYAYAQTKTWTEGYPATKTVRPQSWHWNADVCAEHQLNYVPGVWGDGLSLVPYRIHYGHSSSYQLINLAVLHGCARVLLVGFDMHYREGARHYFDDLSDQPGEYPPGLRKWSSFTGLLACYRTIAEQQQRTRAFEIINCTPGSAMPWFAIKKLEEIDL